MICDGWRGPLLLVLVFKELLELLIATYGWLPRLPDRVMFLILNDLFPATPEVEVVAGRCTTGEPFDCLVAI